MWRRLAGRAHLGQSLEILAYRARNRKFESIPLQQTVRLSRDFSCGIEKPAVAAGCAGPARRHGRQRRAGLTAPRVKRAAVMSPPRPPGAGPTGKARRAQDSGIAPHAPPRASGPGAARRPLGLDLRRPARCRIRRDRRAKHLDISVSRCFRVVADVADDVKVIEFECRIAHHMPSRGPRSAVFG